jgi:hypothetical protein
MSKCLHSFFPTLYRSRLFKVRTLAEFASVPYFNRILIYIVFNFTVMKSTRICDKNIKTLGGAESLDVQCLADILH